MIIYRVGYRRKGQKTWHPITVNLSGNHGESVFRLWKDMPKKDYKIHGLPEDVIISKKIVKRIRR